MKEKRELEVFLRGTLAQLNKLAEQIYATRDYSENAEVILCMKELIIEQMETESIENTGAAAHAAR